MAKEKTSGSDDRKQTIVLTKESVKKGSVRYECENPDKTKAVDNAYIYKGSPILKGLDDDSFPDEITITIRAGGKAE